MEPQATFDEKVTGNDFDLQTAATDWRKSRQLTMA